MKIGYARVSCDDQNTDLQVDALKAFGCDKIFIDQGVSGAKTSRPELGKALAHLRAGDTFVVWRLDRLGRSMNHLLSVVAQFEADRVEFASLTELIDTSSPTGKLIFHVLCAFAEFERNLIIERTQEGLKAARARGRAGGRKVTITPEEVQMAKTLSLDPTLSVSDICKRLGWSRASYYRLVTPTPTHRKSA